jgi:pilus assembly protein TadC
MTGFWVLMALCCVLARKPHSQPSAALRTRHRIRGRQGPYPRSTWTPVAAGLAAACVPPLFLSGPACLLGLLVGPVVAIVVSRSQKSSTPVTDPRALAVMLDLISGVLSSGAPTSTAIRQVASAAIELDDLPPDAPADVRDRLGLPAAAMPFMRVASLLTLGASSETAWTELGPSPPMVRISAAGCRCAGSGAQLAEELRRMASDFRADKRMQALARVQRCGIWSLLPLGLCFLPAFVCLGIVPILIGIGMHVRIAH